MIVGGVIFGLNYWVVVDFIFIMVILIMVGVSFLKLVKYWSSFFFDMILFFFVGFICVFVVVFLVVKFFFWFINWIKFVLFVIYCVIFGIILIMLV